MDYTLLGSVTLSGHLILDGLESRKMVAPTVTHTIGCLAVVEYDPIDQAVGVPIALVGENHFDLSQIQAVQALVGQEVTLVHHRGTFQVLVLSVPNEPTFNHADPQPDDWYSGRIELLTV